MARIKKALWNQPTNSPIVRFGKKSIDVSSFAELDEERFVDSFVIDVCIAKFIEADEKSEILYLPTEFYDWMNSSDQIFKESQVAKEALKLKNVCALKQLLLPVYMPNHWGLDVVDLPNMGMFFDDGLKSIVPPTVLPLIKELLDLLSRMYPEHPHLQSQFRKCCSSFKRFGMPSQAPADSRMIETGSCGIRVIMAAKDFLQRGSSCVGNIQWRYCDMDLHRRDLMLQILEWKN